MKTRLRFSLSPVFIDSVNVSNMNTWLNCYSHTVGTYSSSVVSASKFKSEDPGFDPLAGHGERLFFYPSESTLVQT